MSAALASRVESWVRDQAARLPPWAALPAPRWPWPPPRAPAWPWPPPRVPAWPWPRRQQDRMFREEFERRRRQLRELCRAVRVDTVAELQELLCAMVLAECVYKRPVSEMMRYINKFKSDFGGNIVSLECVQPSLDHVPHRYLLAETGDTLFATFIGTKKYQDIIADVNILQGTIFHEDTAQDLAAAVDSEQNAAQKDEENLGKSYREASQMLRKPKPAAHRGFMARAKGIPALELYDLARRKNRKLVLCGHSLGGAVAALATLAILRVLASSPSKEHNRIPVKCITFSQPPVGNAALRDYVHRRGWQDYFKSYCIPEDLVPRILSPAYFHHYNAQTPEASSVNKTDAKPEENLDRSAEMLKESNGEQLVLGVGPVQKSLWRLSKLVPLEGVRKSLSVLQKQTNVVGKASSQLDSYLQSKVEESDEEPQSLEIQEGSEGIALTPLSDNKKDVGHSGENNRTDKINASEARGSKRWSRVPSLPSYVPFGELYLLGDSSVNTLSDSEYSKMTSVQSVISELRERLQSHSMKSYRARFQKIYDSCMSPNALIFTGIEQLPQFSHLQALLGLTAADSVELGQIVEPPVIRTATSILPLGWNGLPGGKNADPLKVDIIGHHLHMCTLFQAQINGNWYSTVIETLPSSTSYSSQEGQPALQKMRILVDQPLKQPPNYISEDFPVIIGEDSTSNFGFDSLFEDKGCCKGLNGFLIYGTSDFVTISKEVYVRTRRVRLLGLEGAGKTSLLKAMLGQVKERNNAVLECIHVDLHGKGISNGLCYLDSTMVNLQELPLEVRRFKEELQLGLHDLSRRTDLVIVVHNLAHRIPQYHESSNSQPRPALSLLLDEAKSLGIPWILAITNKFSVSAHEQNTLISSAMEAYQASPEMTKVVNSSPFLMPSARNTLQPIIDSTSGHLGTKEPSNRSVFYPVNFALSPFQRKDLVMHVEGVTALRQLVHQVVLNQEEPAFEELARERLSLELEREKAASLQAKHKPPKRDGSVTAAAVGASLGAGLGIVMAVIMGAASALRKP